MYLTKCLNEQKWSNDICLSTLNQSLLTWSERYHSKLWKTESTLILFAF